jgi:hypothetical protein
MKKKHKDNLLKLAAYLETLPDDYEQFDMTGYMMARDGHYWDSLEIEERSKPVCGTVACAVGHGPAAGIRLYGDHSWEDYSDRVFGEFEDTPSCWDYMFSSIWSEIDNTPKGAAARIRKYVALGHAPEGWSYVSAKVTA